MMDMICRQVATGASGGLGCCFLDLRMLEQLLLIKVISGFVAKLPTILDISIYDRRRRNYVHALCQGFGS